MSLTFEMRSLESVSNWSLSTNCLEHIELLRNSDSQSNIDIIFGDANTQAGETRLVERTALSKAVAELVPVANKLTRGFELYFEPPSQWNRGPGAGVILEDGEYHYIRCWSGYWTMQTPQEILEGKEVRHYEPAEIKTQEMGVIRVQVKRGRSDLAKFLRVLEKHLEVDRSDHVTVIWG